MTEWRPSCPRCGSMSDPPAVVECRCGQVSGECTCVNCGGTFEAGVEWWRWAGLETPPPEEAAEAR